MLDSGKALDVDGGKELKAATAAQGDEATTEELHGCAVNSLSTNNFGQDGNRKPRETDETIKILAAYLRRIDEAEANIEKLRVEAFIERGSWCQMETDLLRKRIALLGDSLSGINREH